MQSVQGSGRAQLLQRQLPQWIVKASILPPSP